MKLLRFNCKRPGLHGCVMSTEGCKPVGGFGLIKCITCGKIQIYEVPL